MIPALPLKAYNRLRSLNYSSQFVALKLLESLLPGTAKSKPPSKKVIEELRRSMTELLDQDAINIGQGLYPISVLRPESPAKHFLRFPRLIGDGVRAHYQRALGQTKRFHSKAKELMDDLPEYYRRNFHFQSDGYLSEHSAELYEHQVELLFGGTGDAMRRLILKPMREHFPDSQGKGLTFLEIGAGTGRATVFVKEAFPLAKIVAVDLSDPYLKVAQKKLSRFSKVDFVLANGEDLPFHDGIFDAVYSVFLFHEVPEDHRTKILAESHRVLKPGGFFGAVDSIQLGDNQAFDVLLQNFIRDFHEPFYKNFISKPFAPVITQNGFSEVRTDIGFLSRVWWGKNEAG